MLSRLVFAVTVALSILLTPPLLAQEVQPRTVEKPTVFTDSLQRLQVNRLNVSRLNQQAVVARVRNELFDVVLEDAGQRSLRTIVKIRKAFDLPTGKARALVAAVPITLARGVTRGEAEALQTSFTDAGARVVVSRVMSPPIASESGCTIEEEAFSMLVDSVSSISGRGTMAVGVVHSGRLNTEDEITGVSLADLAPALLGYRGTVTSDYIDMLVDQYSAARRLRASSNGSQFIEVVGWQSVVTGIMLDNGVVSSVERGDDAGVLLRGVKRSDVSRDDLIVGDGFGAYVTNCLR
jgi:ribosomal protein L7/L12